MKKNFEKPKIDLVLKSDREIVMEGSPYPSIDDPNELGEY